MRGSAAGVRIHHLGEQVLVERAPVHANADRLAVVDRNLHDGAEILVAPLAADVPGIDAVLGQRARRLGILGEQQVAVVVEVPDDRDIDAGAKDPARDLRHGGGGGIVVHRHPDELRSGAGERDHLFGGRERIGGVGVGHRLHDHRMRRSNGDISNVCGDRLATRGEDHGGWGWRQFEN